MSKWRQARVMLTAFSMIIVIWSAGCSRPAASTPPEPTVEVKSEQSAVGASPAPSFDAERAWKDLQAQVDFGYRVPGTKTHSATRDWLVKQLTPPAKSVTLQPFTHTLGGRDITMWNIIADIPGAGPAPREQVVLAAHWDTRPTADHDPDPAKRKQPIAGADDGASGVAILLEIARQLKAHPIKRDVQIVLFDGEDYGPGIEDMLLGSQYYADHLPKTKPSWGILLDMVGDADLDIYREPNSERTAKTVNDRVFIAAKALGYLWTKKQPGFMDELYQYPIIDDHIALNKAGVPMADLIDFDYPYWHTTGDTPEHCSAESLKIVGRTVLLAIRSK